ncbi:glycoside hydrolase family 16 protein [Trichoderma velutinum]
MAYFLSTTYAGESLLSNFNWFDGVDPSHGFVSYQSRQNAHEMGLYHIDDRIGVVRLGVDSTHNYSITDKGRPSIRIESKETYDHGLFIADFLHMPPSHCGLWPAFWTYGDNWPFDGEIDIIEGVNAAHTNIISAHTADGCSQGNDIGGLFSGELINTQCAVGTDNIGCGFHPSSEDTSSYGDGFNAAHGGVYAMEWDPIHIRIWHFPRGSIPRDIEAKKPSPDTWGQPIAIFGGSQCKVDNYFKHMRLVLNINFCGDYGDAVWGKTDQCNEFAPTCDEYVAKNPEAFTNAYWDVQYIDAYEFRPRIHDPRPSLNSTRPSWNSTLPRPRPGPDNDERTTTIYKTTRWTETVTVLATGHIPHGPHFGQVPAATTAAIEPVATKAPVNPIKINHYSYLGCFYSNSGFQTFHEVADNKNMTLERCVDLCNNKTYVGIFDSHCFCADNLDAETLATKKEGLCNKECPGNNFEFCGGIVTPKDIDAPRKKFVSETLPLHALTVYGCVEDEKLEAPPAMAPGSNGTAAKPEKGFSKTITKVTEVTVFPISEQDSREKGEHWGDNKHEGDHEWSGQKGEKNDGQKDEGKKYDDGKHVGGDPKGEKHDGDKYKDGKQDGGDQKGYKHEQDKHEDGKQTFDGHEWHNHGGDGHDWNNHEGDGHGHNEGDRKESASWTPSAAEEKDKPAKPEISEIVIPVTKTVVDCPETKQAIVPPTWLPPVDPKPWVPSDPAPRPPPPPSPSHDGDDDHSHDPPHPPPSHDDDHDKSHPPRPPPSTFPETPATGPPVVLVAAASTMYAGLEKYLAIFGLSILVLIMRTL